MTHIQARCGSQSPEAHCDTTARDAVAEDVGLALQKDGGGIRQFMKKHVRKQTRLESSPPKNPKQRARHRPQDLLHAITLWWCNLSQNSPINQQCPPKSTGVLSVRCVSGMMIVSSRHKPRRNGHRTRLRSVKMVTWQEGGERERKRRIWRVRARALISPASASYCQRSPGRFAEQPR
jgi:hypothetical protein